ncbi:MAG: 1-deoxy-D-xylulose-5-phosphate reductoisomerase [Betaproteobacteria bacterium]
MQNITILGATGSIGRSTLDVVARHPGRYKIYALTANRKHDELAELCRLHRPEYAVMADAARAPALADVLKRQGLKTKVLQGMEGLVASVVAPEVDTVMAAIVGAAGLAPSLAAAGAGKKILLANKEALVMAGPVFMKKVRDAGATLLPIDSEHNAIFQCLPNHLRGDLAQLGVRRILLTGSGGPFRTHAIDSLKLVTPDQACAHPNWVMGRKISVDSATMMNKGLEVIEAHWLFGASPDQIEVVIHPQSIVHSMVEYSDGSVLAQLGNPDMRTPIAQALAYPERIEAGVDPLDLFRTGTLTFEAPSFARFPALTLAYQVLRAGGSAPAIFNAANEVAVSAFLDGRLAFNRITDVISAVLDRIPFTPVTQLGEVMEADQRSRELAQEQINGAMVA